MPRYVKSGSPYTLKVDFLVNGELVTPSEATITISGNDGVPLDDFDNETIELVAQSTFAFIEIPEEDNGKTLDTEFRFWSVDFVYNDQSFNVNDFYQLRESVFFPLKPEQVRAVLGLSASEVSDESIDIFHAYGFVQDDVGETDLDAILSDGSTLLPALIDAVKYRAAIEVSVGIQGSMMQMEQADNTLYRRFMEIDFDTMNHNLVGEYNKALSKLAGGSTEIRTFSIMTNDTDAVTGQ